MKLGRRNLFYSIILAGSMLSFLIGYFVCMLPSLYVEYMTEQNLRAVKEQHKAFVENGNYAEVQVKNPTACFSIKLPDQGSDIFITSKLFSVKVAITDERLLKSFSELRRFLKAYGRQEDFPLENDREQFKKEAENLVEIIKETFTGAHSLPVEIQRIETGNTGIEYRGEYEKIHLVSDTFVVLEMGVEETTVIPII